MTLGLSGSLPSKTTEDKLSQCGYLLCHTLLFFLFTSSWTKFTKICHGICVTKDKKICMFASSVFYQQAQVMPPCGYEVKILLSFLCALLRKWWWVCGVRVQAFICHCQRNLHRQPPICLCKFRRWVILAITDIIYYTGTHETTKLFSHSFSVTKMLL